MDSNDFCFGSLIKHEPFSIDNEMDKISQNSTNFEPIANILETTESNDDTFTDLEFDADYRAKIENLNRFLVKTDVEKDIQISNYSCFGNYSQNEVCSFNMPNKNWNSSSNFKSNKSAFKQLSAKDAGNVFKKTLSVDKLSSFNQQKDGLDVLHENFSENLFMNCNNTSLQCDSQPKFNTRKDLFFKEWPSEEKLQSPEHNSSQNNLFLMASQESFLTNKFHSSFKSSDSIALQKEATPKKDAVFSIKNGSLNHSKLTNPAFKPFKPVFKKPSKSLSQTTSAPLTSEKLQVTSSNTDNYVLCSSQSNIYCDKINMEENKENSNYLHNSLSSSNEIRCIQGGNKKLLPLIKSSKRRKEIEVINDENNNEIILSDAAFSETENNQKVKIDVNVSTKPLSQDCEALRDEIPIVESKCDDEVSCPLVNNFKGKKIEHREEVSVPFKKKIKVDHKNSLKRNSNITNAGDDVVLSPIKKKKVVSKKTCYNRKKPSLSEASIRTDINFIYSRNSSRFNTILRTCIDNFQKKYPHLYSTNPNRPKLDSANMESEVLTLQKNKLNNMGTRIACSSILKKPIRKKETKLSKLKGKAHINTSANCVYTEDKICCDKINAKVGSKNVHLSESNTSLKTTKQLVKEGEIEVKKSFKNAGEVLEEHGTLLITDNFSANSGSSDRTPKDFLNEFTESSQISLTRNSAKFGSDDKSLSSSSDNQSFVSEKELENAKCGFVCDKLQSSPVFSKKWSLKTKKPKLILAKGHKKSVLKNFIRSEKISCMRNRKSLKHTGQHQLISSVKQHLYDLQKKSNFPVWVQCDDCKKWRCLYNIFDPAILPKKWTCSLNCDPQFSSCSTPEEHYDEEEHNRVCTFSKFTLGSVVWVTSGCWGPHWWPAMVDDDPDTDTYFWLPSQSSDPNFYHVTFFGSKVTRAWIKSNDVKSYIHKNVPSKLQKVKKSHELELAIEQANNAVHLQLEERRQKFCFATRHEGSWFVNKNKKEETD